MPAPNTSLIEYAKSMKLIEANPKITYWKVVYKMNDVMECIIYKNGKEIERNCLRTTT